MTIAYCFSCGALKATPISYCGLCKKLPATEADLVTSIILSDEVSTQAQLIHFANEVRSNHHLTAPDSLVAKAREVVRDQKYQRLLTSPRSPVIITPSALIAVAGSNVYTQTGILSESIGIETLGSSFTAILAKNSTLPCIISQIFSTGADNQEQITLHLCSGDGNLSKIIQSLGRYQISGISPMPKGKPSILVELKADLGGVTLKAMDNITKTELIVENVSPSSKAAEPLGGTSITPPMPNKETSRLTTTVLHQSAFAVLDVNARDNRKKIVEMAEEKSLQLDHDICQKARSELTNPRTRLSAEIAWLPGVSPRKAAQLIDNLLTDPMAARDESGLPALAHLNLLAAVFETVESDHDRDDLALFIMETAYLAEDLVPEDVLRDINEDRTISGFPEVRAIDQIEEELTERKRYYRGAIKDALDRLPPLTLIKVMTDIVDMTTSNGDEQAPELIDYLVDSYEVETQGILQKEAENVHKLIKAARGYASSGEAAVKPYLDKLDAVARNWDKIAQPIQLSAKARGTNHKASSELAHEIRKLAIDLYNKHDMLTQSQRLTKLLQDLFVELQSVSELVENDANTLDEIIKERKQADLRRDQWAREITYHAQIGFLVFKDTLSISPEGVSWKGQNFPLDSITRVRWGSVRHSVNGISTGTTYTVAFGDRHSEVNVELSVDDIFNNFIEKLWRAVCKRLLIEMLEALRVGRNLYYDDAIVNDYGITLVKHKLFGANEQVLLNWDQVQIWSANGSFCICSKVDKKIYASISYLYVNNTHILEHIIRMALEKPGMRRLSELLL